VKAKEVLNIYTMFDKGTPGENRGRKAMDLKLNNSHDSQAAENVKPRFGQPPVW
jgi:acyl-CoA-binding protein